MGCALHHDLSVPAPPHSQAPHNESSSASTESKYPQGNEPETFWQRTTDDPIAVFNLLLVAFTGVLAAATIWLGYATLKLWRTTEGHAEHLENTAKAATDQVAVARATMINGQRAYVTVEFGGSPMVDIGQQHAHSWELVISWKNTGNTPTKDLVNHTSARFEASDIPNGFRYPDVWIDGRPQIYISNALAPGYSMIGETIPIAVVQLREIKEGRKFFHIYGWVDYNDIFADTPRHRTEYCVQVTVPGEPHMPSVSNIHFLMHREHNGMDEECMRKPTTTVTRRRIQPLQDAS